MKFMIISLRCYYTLSSRDLHGLALLIAILCLARRPDYHLGLPTLSSSKVPDGFQWFPGAIWLAVSRRQYTIIGWANK